MRVSLFFYCFGLFSLLFLFLYLTVYCLDKVDITRERGFMQWGGRVCFVEWRISRLPNSCEWSEICEPYMWRGFVTRQVFHKPVRRLRRRLRITRKKWYRISVSPATIHQMGEMSRVKSRFFPNSLLHSPRLERDGSFFSDLELAYGIVPFWQKCFWNCSAFQIVLAVWSFEFLRWKMCKVICCLCIWYISSCSTIFHQIF